MSHHDVTIAYSLLLPATCCRPVHLPFTHQVFRSLCVTWLVLCSPILQQGPNWAESCPHRGDSEAGNKQETRE